MQIKFKICVGCDIKKVIWKQYEGKRYCQSCWNKIKPSQFLKQTPLPKSQKPIPKESDKRKKENALYKTMRISYLKDHPRCEVSIPGVCSGELSCEIHHIYSGKDRDKYFLDTTTWKATERKCHEWIHLHPIESREMGFLK